MSALSDVLEHGKHACPFQEIHTIDYVNNPSIYSWDTVKLSVRGEERVYLVLTNNMHVITVAERAETSDGRLGWAEHTVTLPESLSLGRSNSLGIAAVAAMASKKTPGSVILSFVVKVDLSGDDSHPSGSGSSSSGGGGSNSGATWYFVSLKVTAEDLAALPFHEAIQSAKQTYKADLMFHTPFCLLHMGGGVSDSFFLSGMDGTIHFFSETADSGAGRVGGGGSNDGGSSSGSGSGGTNDVIAAPFLKDVQAKLTPEIAAVSKHAYTVSAIACVEFPLSHCRVSACGCTNGFLSVSIVDLTDMRVVKHAEAILDGPINSLEFYRHEPKRPQQVPECLLKLSERTSLPLPVLPSSPRQQQQTSALPRVDLLVGGILGYAMWYTNVQEGSLGECYELPLPDGVGGVTCARVVDNNLEQAPEVVVTTFSAAALGFSLAFDSPSAPPSFALKWAKRFEFPLLSLTTCNFSGGVLDDLLILGFRGCHILQCTETWERKERAIAALDALRDIGNMSFN